MKRDDFEAMMEDALKALAADVLEPNVSKSAAKGVGLKSIRYGDKEQRIGRSVQLLASQTHSRSQKSVPMLSSAMVPPCF